MSKEHREVAHSLGVKYLFGRWGLLLHHGLEKKIWTFRILPLDGWILQTKEVEREMRERGFEL